MEGLMALLNNVVFEEGVDYWSWERERGGQFTVKSMFNRLQDLELRSVAILRQFPFKLVWKIDVPLKVKLFFWTTLMGRTLTVDNLNHRGQQISPLCQVCNSPNESIVHLFLHCSVALEIWNIITSAIPELYPSIFIMDSIEEWFVAWPKKQGPKITVRIWQVLPYATIWTIWKNRNEKIF
ncbi:hypothetical protein FRX31_013979, partial [Thalictrum thalictroides]